MFSLKIVLKFFASREAAEFKHLDLNDQRHWYLTVLPLDPTWEWNLKAKLKESKADRLFLTDERCETMTKKRNKSKQEVNK